MIHGHSVVDAQMITDVVQDSTNTDLWNDPMAVDWVDHIDNTFTDPEQWHFDLPSFGALDGASSYNTAEPSFTPSAFVTSGSGAQSHESAFRADSHQNSPPKTAEPESAIAILSRLTQRLYSLYSAVLELANHPDAIDQTDTATLRKGPFADDSAFQRLTGWLVRASSNLDSSSISAAEQHVNTSVAAHDGCALLEDVFSASQKLLATLHSVSEEISNLGAASQDGSPPAVLDQQLICNIFSNDQHSPNGSLRTINQWSGSIIRHMIMANHMLLLNTYLAVVMALQHAVNKQKSISETPNAPDFALPLGEMRTAMVVQMCGYLIQRQVSAVHAYLAAASTTPVSDSSSSDQTTMTELEKDVQKRLAQLKDSLPV